ncbi:MAG: alpha/beta hydrolase, partial [Pseudobdellovibrionaceae bacterium]|nr:alpha/beta hydrolase [Pseudobdellovibrionaceae bacterium]
AGLQLLSDLNQGLGLSLKPKALMDCLNCASLSELLVRELHNVSTEAKREDASSQKFEVLDIRHPEGDVSLRELFHIRSLENLQQIRRLQPQLQIRFLLPLNMGQRLEVNISGTGDLVLFLPAFGLSQAQWMPQMKVFAKEFQVMSVTLPGQGRSGALAHSSLENVAAAINEALELLQIQQPVHVVGSSFGGLVGRAFAQAFPKQVATLTLANSPDSTSILALEDFRKRVAQEVAQEMPSFAKAQYDEALETIDLRFYQELFQKPMGAYLHPDRPLLLIAGRQDRIVDCHDALSLSRSVRHAEVSILDEGGHFPNLANPEVFNQSLRLFIAKHEK